MNLLIINNILIECDCINEQNVKIHYDSYCEGMLFPIKYLNNIIQELIYNKDSIQQDILKLGNTYHINLETFRNVDVKYNEDITINNIVGSDIIFSYNKQQYRISKDVLNFDLQKFINQL